MSDEKAAQAGPADAPAQSTAEAPAAVSPDPAAGRNYATLAFAGALVLALLLYMVSFRVREGQMAVVTTWGSADADDSVLNRDGAGAGLHFKWPWPVQSVDLFERRVQILETSGDYYMKDGDHFILSLYVAWRIDDPLKCMQTGGPGKAAAFLRGRLRAALRATKQNEATNVRSDPLANRDRKKVKLEAIEGAMLVYLRSGSEGTGDESRGVGDFGVAVEHVGIKQVQLPKDVTSAVFERMRSTRQKLAEQARSAKSRNIISKAESDRRRILAFAERRATAIRAEGLAESTRGIVDRYQGDEEFVIFLKKIESLKALLKKKTTILLDADTLPFDLLRQSDGAPQPFSGTDGRTDDNGRTD